jgi:hypothetical protein
MDPMKETSRRLGAAKQRIPFGSQTISVSLVNQFNWMPYAGPAFSRKFSGKTATWYVNYLALVA